MSPRAVHEITAGHLNFDRLRKFALGPSRKTATSKIAPMASPLNMSSSSKSSKGGAMRMAGSKPSPPSLKQLRQQGSRPRAYGTPSPVPKGPS
jgi:hypothetical protein